MSSEEEFEPEKSSIDTNGMNGNTALNGQYNDDKQENIEIKETDDCDDMILEHHVQNGETNNETMIENKNDDNGLVGEEKLKEAEVIVIEQPNEQEMKLESVDLFDAPNGNNDIPVGEETVIEQKENGMRQGNVNLLDVDLEPVNDQNNATANEENGIITTIASIGVHDSVTVVDEVNMESYDDREKLTQDIQPNTDKEENLIEMETEQATNENNNQIQVDHVQNNNFENIVLQETVASEGETHSVDEEAKVQEEEQTSQDHQSSEMSLNDKEEKENLNFQVVQEELVDVKLQEENEIAKEDNRLAEISLNGDDQEEDKLKPKVDLEEEILFDAGLNDKTQPTDAALDTPTNEGIVNDDANTYTASLLQQIEILKQERDATREVNQQLLEKVTSNKNDDEVSILVELQSALQSQMTHRGELEYKLKAAYTKMDEYETKFSEYSDLENKLEAVQTNLTQMMASKMSLEQEVETLRSGREEYEQNTVVLSNRLNEAKKKEATKSSTANRFEADNRSLKNEVSSLQAQLESTTKAKGKLETSMEKLKKKCIDRIQLTEAALVEERHLNEERKKKMKMFVETKAEELRHSKNTNDELRSELTKTSDALNHVRTKLQHMTELYESSSTKNRELVREMNRIKKNTEQLHDFGSTLEFELHRSAQENEEYKQKRNTAKHELMTMLRKLQAEQAVSEKLRDSIKFTFTPKALSQQQLLNESLEDFELELLKLSRRLGKMLPPKTGGGADENNEELNEEENGQSSNGDDRVSKSKKNGKANSRSEWDTSRLLSNLEHETQFVSKRIMAFNSAVERLHVLLDDSGEKNCVSTLNELFGSMAASGNSQRVSIISKEDGSDGTHLNSSMNGNYHDEDEGESFTGTPVESNRRYGRVSVPRD